MTASRKLSVVIPTHNRRALLVGQTLPAVFKQDFPPEEYEVIVVVDGSTDGTAESLRSLKPNCGWRVLEQPNRGPGAGCDFSGGAAKLAREQGLAKRLTPAEYRELRENRERADRAAPSVYEHLKARRFELSDFLPILNDREATAHLLGPDNPAAWDALRTVYRERPLILAELTLLEESPPTELIRFLAKNPADGKRETDRALICGGLYDLDPS